MNHGSKISMAASVRESGSSSKLFHHIIFALFLISFVLVWLEAVHLIRPTENLAWFHAHIVVTTMATTMVSLSRQLPAQNVLLASIIIAIVGGGIQAMGALTAIPFGPYLYTDYAGTKIFNVLPWPVPLIWASVLLNARGVSRLILRPWRKSRLYGFRLIGVTTVLALIFDFGLEPFASKINNFWLWQPTKLPFLWQGTPLSNFLGWLATTLVILAFVTPVLINKSHQKFPSDYHPLMVGTCISVLFVSSAITHQLWMAAGFVGVTSVLTVVLAIRGARW